MKRVRMEFMKIRFGKIEALSIIIIYAVLMVAFMFTTSGTFLNYRIYKSFMSSIPPSLILALGLTFVVSAGEIDLSFPAIITFSGFIFASLYRITGYTLLPFVAAIGGGIIVGLVNGILIAKMGIPSIIATLGTQFFWGGLTVILSGGLTWNIRNIRGTFIHRLFVSRIGGLIPAQFLWAVGIAIILWFILNRHRFGEHLLFIGDNVDVAHVMGINVAATKIKLFTLMGGISAFAAVLLTLEMTTYWTTQGSGFLLIVMASVFIGGTSIFGGKGIIVGTFFGALIIGSIEAGIIASGLGGYWTRLLVGLILIITLIIHIAMEKRKKEGGHRIGDLVFVKGLKKRDAPGS